MDWLYSRNPFPAVPKVPYISLVKIFLLAEDLQWLSLMQAVYERLIQTYQKGIYSVNLKGLYVVYNLAQKSCINYLVVFGLFEFQLESTPEMSPNMIYQNPAFIEVWYNPFNLALPGACQIPWRNTSASYPSCGEKRWLNYKIQGFQNTPQI